MVKNIVRGKETDITGMKVPNTVMKLKGAKECFIRTTQKGMQTDTKDNRKRD